MNGIAGRSFLGNKPYEGAYFPDICKILGIADSGKYGKGDREPYARDGL